MDGSLRNDGARRGGRANGAAGGRSNSGKGKGVLRQTTVAERLAAHQASAQAAAARAAAELEIDEATACFICAEPVVKGKFWAQGKCSHPCCHLCSTRMRALYKYKQCSLCKTELDRVIVSEKDDKTFDEYAPEDTPYADEKLGMLFETRDMLDEVMALLRFNCPEPTCDQICGNWGDLRRHVRADHQRSMCSLCTRHQKIFTNEHTLFTGVQLKQHIAEGNSEVDIDSGFTGHPTCEFCREKHDGPGNLERHTFYDNDALYAHLKQNHEQCFICVKSSDQAIRNTYYPDNAHLLAHFREQHYMCPDPGCLEKKMIVFGSPLDLQAHQLEEHGIADKRSNRDARRVETNFTFDRASAAGSSRGGRGPRGWRPSAEPPRDDRAQRPPSPIMLSEPHVDVPAPAQALPGVPLGVGGRVVPGLGPAASGSRRINFSSQLTAPEPANRSTSPSPEITERHNALLSHVARIVENSPTKLASFKAAVKSYRSAESSAHDLLDTLYSIFDRSIDHVGQISKGVADLLDNEAKKQDLKEAWREFRIETESAFPSLTPVAPTANGTATQASPRSVQRSQRSAAVWARVEQATSAAHQPVKPLLKAVIPGHRVGGASSAARSVPGLASARRIPGTTPWASTKSALASAPVRPTLPQPIGGPIVPPQPSPFTEVVGGPTLRLGARVNLRPQAPSTHDFPGLPSTSYAAREAQKAQYGFPVRKKSDPAAWGKSNGTTDDGFALDDLDAALAASNGVAVPSSSAGGARKAGKKGQVLFRM